MVLENYSNILPFLSSYVFHYEATKILFTEIFFACFVTGNIEKVRAF